MSQSFRHVIRRVHGRFRANFNTDAIKSTGSVVNITAAEIKPRDLAIVPVTDPAFSPIFGVPNPPPQNFIYHLGDANVWVTNVSPHGPNNHFVNEGGGVEYILNVDFPNPIDVAVTITVEDAFPVQTDQL